MVNNTQILTDVITKQELTGTTNDFVYYTPDGRTWRPYNGQYVPTGCEIRKLRKIWNTKPLNA